VVERAFYVAGLLAVTLSYYFAHEFGWRLTGMAALLYVVGTAILVALAYFAWRSRLAKLVAPEAAATKIVDHAEQIK
jgi:hypothetical protein